MHRHTISVGIVLLALVFGLFPLPGAIGQAERPELTVAFSLDPLTMDPRYLFSTVGHSVVRHIYELLLNHDNNGNLYAGLAESWRQVDAQTVEFKLRKGVTFHNGEPFNARTVKFSIENLIAPETKVPNRDSFTDITRVEAPDAYTVRIVSKVPNRPMLHTLGWFPYMVSPRAVVQLGERMATVAIGTGPYKLVEYVPGQRVVIQANDSYWGGRPNYSRITFRIIPENGTRIAALRAGEAAMIDLVPPDQIDSILKDSSLSIVVTRTTVRPIFVGFNFRKQTVKDKRIRQAMNLAIDRRALVAGILQGTASVSNSPVPQAVFSHIRLTPPPYNPERAKALMKEANYAGERIEFYVPNGRYLLDKQIGEAIAGYLQNVGFNVNVVVPEAGRFAAEVFGGGPNWDISLLGWGVANWDPDYIFARLFHSSNSFLGYKNERIDALTEAGRAATDPRRAREVYGELQRLVWEDLPALFLYNQPHISAINRRLKGYTTTPNERMYFMNTTFAK